MLERVKKIYDEFNELKNKISDPKIISDQKKFVEFSRRYAEIKDIAKLYEDFKHLEESQAQAEEILKTEKDPELIMMAEEEIKEINPKKEEISEKLKIELLPKDKMDSRNVIIEVRAGTGGDEAALFAGDISRMLLRFAEDENFRTTILSKSEAEGGGIKEIFIRIVGENAFAKFKYERGVHRVQRIPVTESQGRIHTSAISVAVLPEAEEIDLEIKPEDIRIDVFRASGHGGQSVNTTDSAVRITHLPTNIVVSCQDEKSQLKNKNKAMMILRSRILELEEEKARQERGEARKSQIGTGDRSEKIRTYNFPQDRVTDHRIKKNWKNLPKILEGNLQEIVEALAVEDQARKLAGGV